MPTPQKKLQVSKSFKNETRIREVANSNGKNAINQRNMDIYKVGDLKIRNESLNQGGKDSQKTYSDLVINN